MSQKSYKNWNLEQDSDEILWLCLDKAGSSSNVLSKAVMEELEKILAQIASSVPKGVVIFSGKESGFIAGADVNEFAELKTEQDALLAIKRGQAIMNAIEALPCPTVAMIHGYCLGGGLELALACQYRIVEDDPRTRLGLPEVRLGIHPGFGGTVRMIRTVGALSGMSYMLSGRSLSSRAAKKLKLVHYAVPKRHLHNAARAIINKPPKKSNLPLWQQWLSHRWVRHWLAKYLSRKVAARAPRAHYPAPYALIDLWEHHFDDPDRMLGHEAESVAHLMIGKSTRSLIRIFGLQERLKGLGRSVDFKANHVHVIGGGAMGGDIAAWCALQGFKVTIQDQNPKALANVTKRAYGLYKKRLKQPRLVQATMDRLIPDHKGDGVHRADVIIEAIFENVEAKHSLLKSIEPLLKDDAILATNTSSIPLQTLGKVLKRPERLVGLHFFNPVAKMPLVEIVHSPHTDTDVVTKAAAFTRSIDRLPLPVTSSPGFLVNRILMPYLMEAVVLVDEGVPPILIDKAAVGFGMPLGPIELADTVGLDICLNVAEILSQSMDINIPKRLRKLVDQKRQGKKSGHGFYQFKNDKPVKPAPVKGYTEPNDLRDRLILTLLNEAVACLREGVVEDSDLLDAGVVFGTGFAPFRGGPLYYTSSRGSQLLLQKLEGLQHRHGSRFTPDKGWTKLEDVKEL